MQGRLSVIVFVLLTAAGAPPSARAVGTAFTYQGQLQQDGGGASGPCDFSLSLWDAAGIGSPPTGGSQVGATQSATGAEVTDGLFTLRLDFGAAAFSAGSDRWLQIAVRCPAGGGTYQTLAPRQPLTAAPFALFANSIADGAVSTSKLAAGAVTTSQLAANAVTAAQIADGAVSTSELGIGAVSTAKIGDGQVTGAKLVAPLRLTSAAANSAIGALDGTATGQNGVGVSGTGGTGNGAAGVAGSANAGAGVRGRSTAGVGVFGEYTGPPAGQRGVVEGGAGVVGESSNGDGVRGLSYNGVGVFGEGTGDVGVWGISDSDGIFGESTGAGDGVIGVAGVGAGVHGESTDGTGVLGEGNISGVHGVAAGEAAYGVLGENDSGTGVAGRSEGGAGVGGGGVLGVYGLTGSSAGAGVYGLSTMSNDVDAAGVRGEAKQGVGVRGESETGFAGLFVGPVHVTTVLSAGVKLFRIDHPLDPANRYLVHAAVESPELKNVYDGVVVLDATGEARVDLPEWFEALNRDLRYQLTCIGGFAPVYVAEEVRDAHFRIAGGTPGLKVSWQLTGIRQDAFAAAHPLVVEPEKADRDRGRYLYPEEMGQPASLSVDRSKRPVIP